MFKVFYVRLTSYNNSLLFCISHGYCKITNCTFPAMCTYLYCTYLIAGHKQAVMYEQKQMISKKNWQSIRTKTGLRKNSDCVFSPNLPNYEGVVSKRKLPAIKVNLSGRATEGLLFISISRRVRSDTFRFMRL